MSARLRIALLALTLSGCTVGPNYHRPPMDAPQSFRNPGAEQIPDRTAMSFGDEKWWDVFQDETLQKLVRAALAANYDVRIAATRILEAQAQVGITRADQFPNASASAGYTAQKIPGFAFNVFQLQGLFSWDVNFWGKYRRATEAARANLLATEWGRRQVLLTVVSSVVIAYFELRELDSELEIARRTLASRKESLQLTETLANGGAVSLLDVRQAEQLVETAAETIPDAERRIAQQENLISVLMGENPREIPRGLPLTEQPLPPVIPAGLPSRLLERRPDIRESEQQLIAANAEIGVARAAFFPDLPLTGSAGSESAALANLFGPGAAAWNFAAPITQPVFNAGKLRSNLNLAKAAYQQSLLTYQQTVQQAFSQVSDALIAYRKYREFTAHQELLTTAAESAQTLSDMRYRGGSASYLEVLTSQTNSFTAEINLARARLNERLAVVQVFGSLGGGWEQ